MKTESCRKESYNFPRVYVVTNITSQSDNFMIGGEKPDSADDSQRNQYSVATDAA